MTDSVFLVVDSDPDDLATFASALTSRYASEYEIRTAATASEAHATLAALSVAGIPVALLIVSRDLGDADLLLLLQRARELFPSARRVLSARYLDRSAFDFITGAMRSGRIDYFLYKPCKPVVTRFYPVVDDLLGDLRRTRQERGFEAIRIIGEQWNPAPTDCATSWSVVRSPLGFTIASRKKVSGYLPRPAWTDHVYPCFAFTTALCSSTQLTSRQRRR